MARAIAYVLKAFGRTSETFITNEIYLLERLGVNLRIFSLKTLEGERKHGKLEAIHSPVHFLPETEELTGASFLGWVYRNAPAFARAHAAVLKRHPLAWLATLADALWMCVHYRERFWEAPRKVFFKEWLQAGFIADQLLQRPEIQQIHAHFCHGATTVAMFAARMSKLPFSFTAHAKDIYLKELNPGGLLPLKMRRASFVVTCTEANKKHLDALRPAGAAEVHAIYHGLDAQLFAPMQRMPGKRPRILSVGRLVEKKGFEYLVEACSILRDHDYQFECVIVGGSGPYQSVVEDCISRLKLEDVVKLKGAVTQEQLREIYGESSVFALPCQVLENGDRDGIPNVLAEAMAMRLPVVSTNISGIPELVKSGANGLLVPPKDAPALAEAIAALLDDPYFGRRLAQQARETILKVFDSRTNIVRLAELLLDEPVTARVEEAVPC